MLVPKGLNLARGEQLYPIFKLQFPSDNLLKGNQRPTVMIYIVYFFSGNLQ